MEAQGLCGNSLLSDQVFCKPKTAVNKSLLGKKKVKTDTLTFISPYLLSSETTAKGTGLAESAGKEDPVELDSSLAR